MVIQFLSFGSSFLRKLESCTSALSDRILSCSARRPGERLTFFACAKKVSKETHPDCRAFRASCPPGPLADSGVRRQHIRVLTANACASCACPLRGLFYVREP